MIERKVYQCEHCKIFKRKPKIYFSKDRMYYHEHSCFYNLKNKTCFTCKHKNRNYIKINGFNTDCNLNLLKHEQFISLSNYIMKNCDKWEYIHDVEEDEICED